MRAIKFWNLNLFAHDRKSPFHTPGLFQQFVLSHFLSIWLCNKADLGLVQDTQKIVVVALVNEKMECHILGWISFWSAIIFLYDFVRYFFYFIVRMSHKYIVLKNILLRIKLHLQKWFCPIVCPLVFWREIKKSWPVIR